MADSNLNEPVIIQATRLDTSVLPRNIFSQSYLLYVIAQGTDVGNVANKANEAGKGAYDAQVKNDEQDVTLADHESRIAAAEATLVNHEHRIAAAESTLADHETRITAAETELADHETRIAANESELSNLQKLGKVADNETISKLQSYRDELIRNAGPDGPVNLDLKQLSDLRSQFRMDVKGERPVLPNRSDAAIQRVYKAMTDDINGAIGQNLGNDTLRKYQQANAVYADEAAKLKNTRLKNVLMKGDLTPEVVNNMLFSKNKSEIKTLYNSVGRVGRAQMRNGIIGKAMEKSGGSPDQFLRQLNILQNQTGITFKGQDAAYLKGLKNYLQSTQQAAKAAVTTPTGQQTIPFIIGYGTAMNPATTGAAVSYGLLTRAYESEPFRNAMLRMANTPRGSTAFEKAMQQAQKAINAMMQGAKSDALSE